MAAERTTLPTQVEVPRRLPGGPDGRAQREDERQLGERDRRERHRSRLFSALAAADEKRGESGEPDEDADDGQRAPRARREEAVPALGWPGASCPPQPGRG